MGEPQRKSVGRPSRNDVVISVLRKLEHAPGQVDPSAVVKAAANPKHPLHGRFEWDDSIAGHQHRLQQARKLIASVYVEVTINETTLRPVYYVRDPAKDSRNEGYVSISSLQGKPARIRALMQAELARIDAILTRTIDLADALGVKEETLEVMRGVRRLRKRVN